MSFKSYSSTNPPSKQGLEYKDCIPYRRVRTSKKLCPWYDTKMHLMVKLHFLRSEECGLPHYNQIHSDLVRILSAVLLQGLTLRMGLTLKNAKKLIFH